MKKLIAYCFAAIFFITGCEQEVPEASSPNSENPVENTNLSSLEVAFPEIEGEPVTFNSGNGEEITLLNKNGQYVWMGDIMLTQAQVDLLKGGDPNSRAGLANVADYWPRGVVYYDINPNLPNQYRVTDAIAHWKQKCPYLTFQVRNQYTTNYVYFTTGTGCSSYIGRVGGRQDITLASGCTTGSTIHEIGHALGLLHEHTRQDRNSYLTVNYGNIQTGQAHNFDIYTTLGYNGFEISTMDFNSIMLYGSYAFSKNGAPTIVKKDGSTYVENRTSLSQGDVDIINLMYGPPYARIEFENEDYESSNWDFRAWADVYVAFYADKNYTQPYTLPSAVTFKFQEVTSYTVEGYETEYNDSEIIPSGSHKVLLRSYFMTEEASWDQNGYERGSYSATIKAVDNTGYNVR